MPLQPVAYGRFSHFTELLNRGVKSQLVANTIRVLLRCAAEARPWHQFAPGGANRPSLMSAASSEDDRARLEESGSFWHLLEVVRLLNEHAVQGRDLDQYCRGDEAPVRIPPIDDTWHVRARALARRVLSWESAAPFPPLNVGALLDVLCSDGATTARDSTTATPEPDDAGYGASNSPTTGAQPCVEVSVSPMSLGELTALLVEAGEATDVKPSHDTGEARVLTSEIVRLRIKRAKPGSSYNALANCETTDGFDRIVANDVVRRIALGHAADAFAGKAAREAIAVCKAAEAEGVVPLRHLPTRTDKSRQ